MRLLNGLETVVIAAAVFLGVIWPSIYTLIGLVILPSGIMAAIGVLRPAFLAKRRRAQKYVHACAALSLLAIVSEAVWLSWVGAW